MKPKKNPKISLEKYRVVFFEVGTVFALAIILLAFEWTSRVSDAENNDHLFKEKSLDQTEFIINTRPEKKEKRKKPEIKLIINEVPDDVDIEEPNIWDPEVNGNESIDLYYPEPEQDESFIDEPVDFIKVEDKPLFNGGDPMVEFRKYIAMNLVYPPEAIENGVEGRVIVSFVIDTEGNLTDINVIDSPHRDLTEAALKVLQSSPAWTPGKQRTKPVPVKFYFPVVFRLN